MKIHLVSLGCARNQVDSELMLGRLIRCGCQIAQEPEEAQVIIVNTCSFIESAVDESVDTILALARYKENGRCRRLIVAGCLPERYREDINDSLPEVDVFLGTGAFDQIERAVSDPRFHHECLLPSPGLRALEGPKDPRHLTDAHMAYIKIAEGCDSRCTYCIIPKLRGQHRSRPMADIVAEAEHLMASGVKEINLVAQDTTDYGRDLTPPQNLGGLLSVLSDVSKDLWVRFLYGHPEHFDRSLLKVVAARENICPYFDIPIQHVSPGVLQRMGRYYGREDLLDLFERIRQALPQAAIRTSVMVGFPGESEDDFLALSDFIDTVRFDHLGVFTYSDGEDLPSHRLPDHVPQDTAQERLDRLMCRQKKISLDRNQAYVGTTQRVLVEQALEPHLFAARTMFQAPEVDGLTFVHTSREGNHIETGMFVEVEITDAMEYDLISQRLPR